MSPALQAAVIAEAEALEARARALRAQVAAAAEPDEDPLLDVAAIRSMFARGGQRAAIGARALRAASARGELQVLRGPRRRLVVRRSELQRWLAARPPAPPRAPAEPLAESLDAWAADASNEVASRRAR